VLEQMRRSVKLDNAKRLVRAIHPMEHAVSPIKPMEPCVTTEILALWMTLVKAELVPVVLRRLVHPRDNVIDLELVAWKQENANTRQNKMELHVPMEIYAPWMTPVNLEIALDLARSRAMLQMPVMKRELVYPKREPVLIPISQTEPTVTMATPALRQTRATMVYVWEVTLSFVKLRMIATSLERAIQPLELVRIQYQKMERLATMETDAPRTTSVTEEIAWVVAGSNVKLLRMNAITNLNATQKLELVNSSRSQMDLLAMTIMLVLPLPLVSMALALDLILGPVFRTINAWDRELAMPLMVLVPLRNWMRFLVTTETNAL
jgi:hypothetical protein